MPKYGMPGVDADRGKSRVVGGSVLLLIVVVVLATVVYRNTGSPDGLRIALRTEQIGDGISEGSDVRLDGVRVGKVARVVPDALGTQRITLQLDDSRLHGIDDSMKIDYSPANLFGISEIELRRGTGGSPLHNGALVEFTGKRAADVYDATLGSVLRSLSQVGANVLTPQMVTALSQLSSDFRAFTPLMQALITVARSIADNQTMKPSELAGNLGPAFTGASKFAAAGVEVINRLNHINIVQTDKQHFDYAVETMNNVILPQVSKTLGVTGGYLSGTTDMLAPTLVMLAQLVPRPQQSAADLRALLGNLRRAMPDTPDGPVLDLDVDLRGVPGIAVPLLGSPATPGGAR
ncbi:MlaD family protein [Nocardia altamirensis]|uniref:MlaD family protein n=1 Tax=Nocardia altamirensis TaxID=472158 RepID=UPI00084006D1|nr:MlaD family protein [Nocardia altamirensis]